MEEDDHDELLQCTDDESLSEQEDQCLPIDKPEENYRHTLTYFNHTKLEFITTKLTLIFSTTVLLILLPLYLESINVKGNAYSMILTNTSISTILFVTTMVIAKCFCEKYRNIRICSFPVRFPRLILLSGVYFLCAFMVIYALDRKRVLCHLQDPIKGVVLVFSLLYYFFFCRKLMGLQRIFSATTIIVGLFIAVDYGLCDEFRCRGYEREKLSDDTGPWTWQTHAIWTTVYISGLALFAAYFTLLDRFILSNNEMEFHNINIPSTFLSTVSRSVSFPNTNSVAPAQFIGNTVTESPHLTKKHSVVHLAMWIHIIGLVITMLLFWTDFTHGIGKSLDAAEFWNYTINGLICHFQKPQPPSMEQSSCGNVFLFSWIFMCSYVLFVVMSIKFLILSQSAVYTIASMSTALPLVGVWWSLFHVAPHTDGLLVWSPSLTGELICALLGLPIVIIGLFLLCKAHFKDYQWSRLSTTHIMPSNHFA
ncbi:hypothetical protein NQ318_009624 [Aromia moschata]|uniref:Uncharacterized protein n=1 Tax=Aromia moschata TaxID=1265417 RepID=A0AAV8Y7G1_9CUCU|nr:hypothetical protein NQ318_009624 [Aromia moschata]